MARLAHSEIESLLRFVHDASTIEREAAVTPEIVERLSELVPTAESVGYSDLNWNRRLVAYGADAQGFGVDFHGDEAYWHLHEQHAVCAYFARTGDLRTRKISDLLRLREWRAREIYNVCYRPLQYEIDVGIPARPGSTKTFIFRSSKNDFTERDRLVLELLRPHLHLIDETFERQRRIALDVALTRREREVLSWVESGKTNAEIAEILWISPLTVAKHLEHTYEKLGVRSRTAAVARLRAAGRGQD
jgi:DNA-binding CsgD family transcriptional regulator